MKKLLNEIWDNTNSDSGTDYVEYHRGHKGNKDDFLQKFLFSTMDEVRIYWANKYSSEILRMQGIQETAYFRTKVLAREISSNIDYVRQRDHAAHTLHNYLFGWYIYMKNRAIRDAFRKCLCDRYGELKEKVVINCFGNLWIYVSLLHDIGYIFEGAIQTLDPNVQSERVVLGTAILNDFFQHSIWPDIKFGSLEWQKKLLEMTKVPIPNFECHSIATVGNSLRVLGDLEKVREAVKKDLEAKDFSVPDALRKEYGLPMEAFDLWKVYYSSYNQKEMVTRIEQAKIAFQHIMIQGMPGLGIRLLDHGVCSGLILLNYITFYYRIYCGLPESEPKDRIKAEIIRSFKEETVPYMVSYDPRWWWIGLVWATAATALHNLHQYSSPWPGCERTMRKLKLNDDPLTYLGILVDIIEEWDRYTVIKKSIFTGTMPIQGTDVKISIEDDLIKLNYEDKARSKSVKEALNNALNGWQQIVKII